MDPIVIACIAVFVLWLLLELKTSRADGKIVRKIHPYRQLMPYIMRGRNESIAYLHLHVRAEPLEAYLKEAGPKFGANVTHAIVAAMAYTLHHLPKMNRFIMGRRTYEREGLYITFSMKRKKLDKESKLSVVKLRMNEEETFKAICERINGKISTERSGKKTHADKEYALFNLMPRFGLRAAVGLVRLLDYYNLLPRFFIEPDGMYTSAFVANVGSIGLPPAWHHLYEWGNCPFFVSFGAIEERVVWEDGEPKPIRVLPYVLAFDERIEDGLSGRHGIEDFRQLIENPHDFFGCLSEDGSDHQPIFEKRTR